MRNKSGSTRLGFAAMLKFLGWKGRFPRGRFELPDDAIEHLARQVKVPAVEIGSYDFAGRQIKNHRREIRNRTGFRICSVADAEALAGWLAKHIAQDERRVEHVRVLLLGHCKDERIEPPTPERVARIVDSGIRQADAMLVATVIARLKRRHITGIEALLKASVDIDVETAAAAGQRLLLLDDAYGKAARERESATRGQRGDVRYTGRRYFTDAGSKVVGVGPAAATLRASISGESTITGRLGLHAFSERYDQRRLHQGTPATPAAACSSTGTSRGADGRSRPGFAARPPRSPR